MSALRFIAGAAFAENSHNLLPINQIQALDSGHKAWRSTGEKSAFLIQFRYALRSGWYMVSQKQLIDSSTVSQLYFDFGKGFSKKHSISQKLIPNKTYKRLVYLSSKPKAVRYNPTNRTSNFTIEKLHFAPVTTQFAISRLLKRVLKSHSIPAIEDENQLRELIVGKAKREQRKFIDVLFDCYEQTHLFREASDPVSYADWLRKHEGTKEYQREHINRGIYHFADKPKISIIMPVYNAPDEYLRKALDSVLQQSYSNWELCVSDDASNEAHVRTTLEEFVARDTRIKVCYAKSNGNISVASNAALSLATGKFIALLDHDDELAPNALYFMVEAVNKNAKAKFFYSDEDKLDVKGRRRSPFFKPDWNQDLFYSYNYICHFTMLSRALVEELDGFREGVEGSQDYDLFLRAAKLVGFKEIIHIPRVLYHWRMLSGSTASNAKEKKYTQNAGVIALRDHFNSLGKDVVISPSEIPNVYRVIHPIPDEKPLVSLIIPTRDMLEVLRPCVESILNKTDYDNYEIIIIDNQSYDTETHAWFTSIESNPKVRIIQYDEEFNYSAINNFAVEYANGSIIGLINNDIEVISDGWLTEMLSHAVRSDIGCVGAKLFYPDNTVQHAGVVLGLGKNAETTGIAGHIFKGIGAKETGYFTRAALPQNYSAVTAACLLVKKKLFQQVGGFDEENLKVAFNDVDFCLKVRDAGYRNIWTPYAQLYHYESKSRGYENTPEKKLRFQSEVACMKLKWSEKLQNDPAYNCNLTLKREDSGLRD